jgi:hypothetical protein
MATETAQEKFIEIKTLFQRMSFEVICVVVESYNIWRTLTFSRSVPEVGQEKADKTAKQMSLYTDFFMPTEQSHLHTFTLGLMKLFDRNPRALSFANLIRKIEVSKAVLTEEVLFSVHPQLQGLRDISDTYEPITQANIDHFAELQEKYADLISNLKDIRDKQFAHTDMKVNNGTFVPNEIEDLIKAVQEMYNKLSNSFERSSTMWDYMGRDAKQKTEFLLENLERGEIQRLKEIEEKWKNYE